VGEESSGETTAKANTPLRESGGKMCLPIKKVGRIWGGKSEDSELTNYSGSRSTASYFERRNGDFTRDRKKYASRGKKEQRENKAKKKNNVL